MTFHDAAAREFPPFSTDACIKCNVCTTVCPVARVTDDFPGPKYVGPQAQRFRGPGVGRDAPDHTVDLCSGCGICTRACPAGVLIAETNNRARAAIVDERGSSIRNRIISDTDLIARFGVPLAPLANIGLQQPDRPMDGGEGARRPSARTADHLLAPHVLAPGGSGEAARRHCPRPPGSGAHRSSTSMAAP